MKKEKVLISGGTGFIGSEVVRQAIARGWDPVVIDSMSYAADKARLKGLRYEFEKADIADSKRIEQVFKKHKPALVLHLAAESHVDRSIEDGAPFIRTNVHGTYTMLEASRKAGVKRFVHISTDEVYGEIEKGKFKEGFPLEPNSPYSASKASGDLLVNAYRRTFGFPAIIVRPSNNYGPWQYPEKFIPVIIYRALKGEKIPVYGKGTNVREWLYVSDCAAAMLDLLERGKDGEDYNVGSGEERTNMEIVETILGIMKKPMSLIEYVKDRPGHDVRYSLDSKKLRRELGWKPEVSFKEGMRRTVAWNIENLKWIEEKAAYLRDYWKRTYKKA